MWRQKSRHFLQPIANTIGWPVIITWSIAKRFAAVVGQPRYRHSLMISSCAMGITAITLSIVGVFNYKPDTSVPFSYIPPPAEGYYIEATMEQLTDEFFSHYLDPATAGDRFIGKSFIFKDILMDEAILDRRHETWIIIRGLVQFVFQDPSDLQKLKEGDRVDIIGVCVGISKEYELIVVSNCKFLSAGVAPLPIPGGSALLIGGY